MLRIRLEVTDLKIDVYVYMYCVLVNEETGRVLVSGKEEDMGLSGWHVDGCFEDWYDAYERAVDIADAREYMLEWYIEEQMEAVEKRQIMLLRPN